MDFGKLRSIAFMAMKGTENERSVARKILKKHGYTPEQLLMPNEIHSDKTRVPKQSSKTDEPSETNDIIDLSDYYFDDMVDKINSFSQSLVDSISSFQKLLNIFRK